MPFLDLPVQAGPPTVSGSLTPSAIMIQSLGPGQGLLSYLPHIPQHPRPPSLPHLQPGQTLRSLSFKASMRVPSSCSTFRMSLPRVPAPFPECQLHLHRVFCSRAPRPAHELRSLASVSQGKRMRTLHHSLEQTLAGVQLCAGGGSGISTWDSSGAAVWPAVGGTWAGGACSY